jgi:AcrR family transcriptional regulator
VEPPASLGTGVLIPALAMTRTLLFRVRTQGTTHSERGLRNRPYIAVRLRRMTELPRRRRGRPPSGGREAILAAALQLLRERGIAQMTTRRVAELAGVSEASVFYHYSDRAGLLEAAFEVGVRPLQAVGQNLAASTSSVVRTLTRFGRALERFLDQVLPILAAAQSDVELRDALRAYMNERELGPHGGIDVLTAYFKSEQAEGCVRTDVDARAIALMFAGACYLRSAQRQLPVHRVALPSPERVARTLEVLLSPDDRDRSATA